MTEFFFLSDPYDDFRGQNKPRRFRRFLLRVINIALAGLLAFTALGSAALAIRLVVNH